MVDGGYLSQTAPLFAPYTWWCTSGPGPVEGAQMMGASCSHSTRDNHNPSTARHPTHHPPELKAFWVAAAAAIIAATAGHQGAMGRAPAAGTAMSSASVCCHVMHIHRTWVIGKNGSQGLVP